MEEKKRERFLFHVTDRANLESIMEKGLLPSVGGHRKKCRLDMERESDDPRVSMCEEGYVDAWRRALYKKDPDAETVTLKVMVEGLRLKRRLWTNGYEYACWDLIPAERIEPMEGGCVWNG